MAGRAGGGRSSDGIDGAVLEAGMGSAGTILEACPPEGGGGRQDVRQVASVPSQVQPGAARAKERLRRRRAVAQTAGSAGTGVELRARSPAAAVADGDEA